MAGDQARRSLPDGKLNECKKVSSPGTYSKRRITDVPFKTHVPRSKVGLKIDNVIFDNIFYIMYFNVISRCIYNTLGLSYAGQVIIRCLVTSSTGQNSGIEHRNYGFYFANSSSISNNERPLSRLMQTLTTVGSKLVLFGSKQRKHNLHISAQLKKIWPLF